MPLAPLKTVHETFLENALCGWRMGVSLRLSTAGFFSSGMIEMEWNCVLQLTGKAHTWASPMLRRRDPALMIDQAASEQRKD